MNSVKSDPAEVKKFLSELWPGADDGVLSLVSIKGGKVIPLNVPVRNINGFLICFLKQEGDLYHTVGLLRNEPETGRGVESDVVAIPGLWFDLDCAEGSHKKKDLPSRAEAEKLVRELPWKPSITIWSGGGFHLYFLFKEPWRFNSDEERLQAKSLSSRFQQSIIRRGQSKGWKLDNTSDLVRLLRLPGTYNKKRDPVPVEVLEESGIRYEPSDLEPVEVPQATKPKSEGATSLESLLLPFSIRKLIKDGAAERERSEATASVIVALVKAGATDGVILKVFEEHHSGIGAKYMEKGNGRRKWLRDEIERARGKFSQEDEDERDWSGWPSPLSSEAFSGFAGGFVELASRKSEADPAAILLTFLSRFGVEAGSGPFLFIGDTEHRTRINVAVVGATSKSRKGTSAKPVDRLFSFDSVSAEDCYIPARVSPGPLSSGEGLIYAVRDPVEQYKDGEMLVVDPGVTDKRLFIQDEELASVLIVVKRDGNIIFTIIRSMWDSGNLEPLTKSNRIRATGAHCAFVGHITLHELNRRLEEVEFFSGFGNRILWVCARRQGLVPFPEPMPAAELASLQWELKRILETARGAGEMAFSEESREMWVGVYPDLSRDRGGVVGAVCDRAEAQVIRLSMIYSLLDSSRVIEPQHLRSALAVWKYCEASAAFIFSEREGGKRYAEQILSALQEKGWVSTTELWRAFSKHTSKSRMEQAISELIAQGKVVTKKEATKGRPVTYFAYFAKDEK